MADDDNKKPCVFPEPCVPNEEPKEIYPAATPSFGICVGDFSLYWDGTRLTQERIRTTQDGQYGRVTLQDGCIVAYAEEPVAVYTPPLCGGGFGGGGGSGGTELTVNPDPNNLSGLTSSGILTTLSAIGQGNIAVSGSGTLTDPLIISGGSGGSSVVSPAGPVTVNVFSAGNYTVSLRQSGIDPGTYGGFRINEFGLVEEYTPPATGNSIVSVLPGLEIDIDGSNTDAGVVVIEHPVSAAGDSTYNLGAYTVSVSTAGHIQSVNRTVSLEGGQFTFGDFVVGVDQFGTIVSIQSVTGTDENLATDFFTVSGIISVEFDQTAGRTANVNVTFNSGPTTVTDVFVATQYVRFTLQLPVNIQYPQLSKVFVIPKSISRQATVQLASVNNATNEITLEFQADSIANTSYTGSMGFDVQVTGYLL